MSASVKMAAPDRSSMVASVVAMEECAGEASVVEKASLRRKIFLSSRDSGISDNFAIVRPDLAQTGFGMHQVRQIIDKREAIGKTLEHVQQGLDHADAALVRDGSFPKPAGWISRSSRVRRLGGCKKSPHENRSGRRRRQRSKRGVTG